MVNRENLNKFFVILVEPKYGGNIGAVARTMMNFGFNNLYLVNPCELDDDCYTRAVHATKVIEYATIFPSFTEAIKDIDYLAATSSIESKTDKKHLRNSILIENFAEKPQARAIRQVRPLKYGFRVRFELLGTAEESRTRIGQIKLGKDLDTAADLWNTAAM